MRKTALYSTIAAGLIATLSATVAFAQLTGQITGTITDPSGSVVPNANIAVVNEQTGIKREAQTNQSGIYTVPLLQPGKYSVTVEAQGFRSMTRPGVELEVAQTAALNFTLEVGAASESITVQETPHCWRSAPTP